VGIVPDATEAQRLVDLTRYGKITTWQQRFRVSEHGVSSWCIGGTDSMREGEGGIGEALGRSYIIDKSGPGVLLPAGATILQKYSTST
jgi:hypothetical protein